MRKTVPLVVITIVLAGLACLAPPRVAEFLSIIGGCLLAMSAFRLPTQPVWNWINAAVVLVVYSAWLGIGLSQFWVADFFSYGALLFGAIALLVGLRSYQHRRSEIDQENRRSLDTKA